MAALGHAREGARRYGALLALPGARRPVIASAVGSMPIGMFGLAILLLAQDATGSFAVAGRVVGAFGIGNALGAVAQGRLMDRFGQTWVLRTAAAAHALACGALVAAALADAATAWLYVCAAAGGVASGLVLAPATVVASTLLDTAAPPGTVTEAFAVMVMGIVAGTALGNALGGAIVEGWSYEAGALVAGAIAMLGAAIAVARRRTLIRPA